MDKSEIERRWPEAVARARNLREVYGDGVRLLYARNAHGEELGKPAERIIACATAPRPPS